MSLETGSFINDLAPSNPLGSDPAGQGDDHLRLIKGTVQATLPNMGAQLGRVRSQDTAVSISSIWNTNHFLVTASATTTVVLTLPPQASITSGFYVDLTTLTGANVSLFPSAGATVNGAASFAIPEQSTARAFFTGGTAWRCNSVPNGNSGSVFGGAVVIKGGLTVSGATVLSGGLSVSGATVLAGSLTVSGATVLAGGVSVSGNAVLSGNLTVAGAATISGALSLTAGQISFPAAQNASAGANVLDDYEEGTWTPAYTFATPGNLSVSYTSRSGTYTKIGNRVYVDFTMIVSACTHTTASGILFITGLPFAAGALARGSVDFSSHKVIMGSDFAGMDLGLASGASQMNISVCGVNDNSNVNLTTINHTSGLAFEMSGAITYRV